MLRSEGFGTTPSETLDAVSAVGALADLSSDVTFREALRTSLAKREELSKRFDHFFDEFWLKPRGMVNPLGRVSIQAKSKPIQRSIRQTQSNEIGRGRTISNSKATSLVQSPNNAIEKEQSLFALYSPIESLGRKNFGELFVQQDRLLLKRGVRSFARAMATRPGRRFEASDSESSLLDFRKTFRSSLKIGGDIADIKRRSKKISKTRLVVLCDISGSMDVHSARILKVLYHMANTIRGSQVFAFSTKVVQLNKYLQGVPLREAADLISQKVDIWSSGTRIGAALGELVGAHSGLFKTTTVFVVISDGWELGDLGVLRSQLQQIRRRVKRIVWLNPQADSPDYSPLAEGMKTALPYIDYFSGLDALSSRAMFKQVFGLAQGN